MEIATVKELYAQKENYLNKKIQINGWVRTVRASKTFGFIEHVRILKELCPL
ncbi:hypothetical protein Psch_03126 [Pelotomaculum schinkii]|uniref:Asparagine--tRNA ligase n=1 Tax=Pelotomaculum schinkii TaxID=78350 RepID=A0A4Y7RAU0_9FIRM|nr:hypothetical protein [Pelotomaculum schinkii]TEB06084.1 hypothetical protein Psch_03126 [Pelotomaculum schinkii]